MASWTFGPKNSGLYFKIEIIEGIATVTMTEGSMDLNAFWFSNKDNVVDGESKLSKRNSSLNMNGVGSIDADGASIVWDQVNVLSLPGLGKAGTSKTTFMTAGETATFNLDASTLAYLANNDLSKLTLGIRGTSINGSNSVKVNAFADDNGPGIGANPNTSNLLIGFSATGAANQSGDYTTDQDNIFAYDFGRVDSSDNKWKNWEIGNGDRITGATFFQGFQQDTPYELPPTFGDGGNDKIDEEQFEAYYGTYVNGIFEVVGTRSQINEGVIMTTKPTHTLILYDNDTRNASNQYGPNGDLAGDDPYWLEAFVVEGWLPEDGWKVGPVGNFANSLTFDSSFPFPGNYPVFP